MVFSLDPACRDSWRAGEFPAGVVCLLKSPSQADGSGTSCSTWSQGPSRPLQEALGVSVARKRCDGSMLDPRRLSCPRSADEVDAACPTSDVLPSGLARS